MDADMQRESRATDRRGGLCYSHGIVKYLVAGVIGLSAVMLAGCGGASRTSVQPNATSNPTTTGTSTNTTPANTATTPAATSTVTTPANTDTTSSSGGSKGSWGSATEASFMSSCNTTSGGKESYCRCVLTYLEGKYTADQALQLVRSGNATSVVRESGCTP